MKKLTAIILVLVMAFSLMSCGEKASDEKKDKIEEKPGKVEDLSKSSTQETPKPEELLKVIQNPDGFQKGYRNFNAKLLAECYQGETMMVSPFSLYAALGMLGNGASGETLKEMEQLFGCSVEEASKAVLYLMLRSEEADVVRIADSIWIEDGTPVNDAFLSRCGLYYRSSVMRAHLPAESTIQKINDFFDAFFTVRKSFHQLLFVLGGLLLRSDFQFSFFRFCQLFQFSFLDLYLGNKVSELRFCGSDRLIEIVRNCDFLSGHGVVPPRPMIGNSSIALDYSQFNRCNQSIRHFPRKESNEKNGKYCNEFGRIMPW